MQRRSLVRQIAQTTLALTLALSAGCTSRSQPQGEAGATAPPAQQATKELAMDFRREAINLNGTWDVLRDHPDEPLWETGTIRRLGPWRPVSVPGTLLPDESQAVGRETHCAWARKTFEVSPAQMRRQAVLKWGCIRFGAIAWVNGRQIAQHEPIGPHTALLPAGTLRAGENEIVLKVPGWAGVPKGEAGWPLVPTGGSTQGWGAKAPGIIDDIWIEFHDGLYLKYILAIPDFRKGEVTFRIWPDAIGELPSELSLTVELEAPDNEHILAESTLALRGRGEPVEIVVSVDKPIAWTWREPRLYRAVVRAKNRSGKRLDDVGFTFGMRQVEVMDGHYRLNDRPLWLRGSNLVNEWNWGDTFNREVKRYIVDEARAMNLNCFRTHTLPPVTSWADVCDRYGTMILAEMPVLYNYQKPKLTPE